jgi:hypothetical protein
LLGRFGAGLALALLLGWQLIPAERGILALRPGLPDRPGAVLAADFNQDGKVDLLQANFESSDVSFFQEDPSGNYVERSPSPFLTAAGPTFLATADLNADTRPDAVVVNRIARTVTVLISVVDLTFQTKPSIVAARGAQAVAIADYNRDGRPDLAITGEVDDTVSIYVGRGDGTFGFARSVDVRDAAQKSASTKVGAFGIVAADFNRDSKVDLAVTQFLVDRVAILLGNGNGAFQAPVVYCVGRHPTYAVATRLNDDLQPGLADDFPDLTVLLSGGQATDPADTCQSGNGATDNGGIVPVLSAGNGTVTIGTPLPGGPTDKPRQLAAGRILQSPFDDVVVANLGSNTLSLYAADGSGGFLPAPTVLGGGTTTLRSPNAVTLADRDGNGFPDRIAATNFDGDSLTLFDGGGANPFVETSFSPVTATRAPSALATGFLDAGSSEDLAVLSQTGDSLQTFSSLGNAFFFKRRQSPFPAGSAPTALALADFDRDFFADVAVAVTDQDGSAGATAVPAVQILQGSGFATFGAVVGTCSGGTSAGASCTSDAFCPGGTCAFTLSLGVCSGGDNSGKACTGDPDCPSGTCLLPEAATPLAAPAASLLATDLNLLDADRDGVINTADNCPSRYNPAQTNTRGKTCLGGSNNAQPCVVDAECPGGSCIEVTPRGDDCDSNSADPDSDLVVDLTDNCLDVYNPSQADADDNEVGTACDHDPDLVALEAASGQIEVLIRQVEGGFLPPAVIPVGGSPGEMVDGQFTAPDGHPDLALTLVGAGSLQILSGDGTGGFTLLAPILLGGAPAGLAAFDANPQDEDLDGVLDSLDNCPTRANASQQDTDKDGAGDACSVVENPDGDVTVTFLAKRQDNCPDIYNFIQFDTDQDGIGDVCDSSPNIYNPADDQDADGVANPTDNCPTRYNPGQENFNTDSVGNACAQTTDPDLDSFPTATLTRDNCPDTYNLGQEDADANSIGDSCDNISDLAVADSSGNVLRLVVQFPPGSWVVRPPLSVGPGPTSVAAVDLNGNLVRDLVVANTAGSTLSVFLGNGDGTFLQDPAFEVASLPGPRALRGGSFRRDPVIDFGEVSALSPSLSTPMITVNILSERADIDGSGRVGGRDLAFWAQGFGFSRNDPGYPGSRQADVNLDGKIDGLDLVFITSQFGKEMPAAPP